MAAGLAYRETYMSYPDNPRILSHTAGDFRAAIAPALAYTAVPAGSFKVCKRYQDGGHWHGPWAWRWAWAPWANHDCGPLV